MKKHNEEFGRRSEQVDNIPEPPPIRRKRGTKQPVTQKPIPTGSDRLEIPTYRKTNKAKGQKKEEV